MRQGFEAGSVQSQNANIKYMSTYDKDKPSSCLSYLDANNLYGWSMSQPLPVSDFKWKICVSLLVYDSINKTINIALVNLCVLAFIQIQPISPTINNRRAVAVRFNTATRRMSEIRVNSTSKQLQQALDSLVNLRNMEKTFQFHIPVLLSVLLFIPLYRFTSFIV